VGWGAEGKQPRREVDGMSDTLHCRECKQSLVEIDNCGELLRGCATCNIWWPLGGGMGVILSKKDLDAIQKIKRAK